MEVGAAEAIGLRQKAVSLIRARVTSGVGSWLKDDECIQLAIASAAREPRDLIEFMFKPSVARLIASNAATLKMLAVSVEEWVALFGPHVGPGRRTALLEKASGEHGFATHVTTLQNSLRTTVSEKAQGSVWTRTWNKAVCVAAMHLHNHEEFLAGSLGNVVRADSRRLEELRSQLDDAGVETMLLAQVFEALAQGVVQ